MGTILVATTNQHKIEEIRDIFAANGVNGWELISLAEYPDYEVPEENGETFAANAIIKAAAACQASGLMALSDDSGLSVDALDGAPGVYSARYAGEGHDDAANRVKLLQAMADVPEAQRTARFVCAAALAFPGDLGNVNFWSTEGTCEGRIAWEEKGENGFGYDSLFYLPQYGKTMAEISSEEKNAISHRGSAFEKVARMLNYLSDNSLDF